MTVFVVPGAVGNTNPARAIFDNPFAHGCSADVQYARGEPILRMTGVDGQHASAGFALP